MNRLFRNLSGALLSTIGAFGFFFLINTHINAQPLYVIFSIGMYVAQIMLGMCILSRDNVERKRLVLVPILFAIAISLYCLYRYVF